LQKKISYIEDFESWKNEFTFYTEIKIRFSETDMIGHVNNVSPFIYFEQARIEFMMEKGIFTEKSIQTTIPIVADLQCDYLEQLYFGNVLKIYVKANSVGNSSLDIHYLGLNEEGKPCLTGRGRLVNIDVKSGTPAKFTEEERQRILS